MKTSITVKAAADYLGCSTRRVRTLLAQGRMTGNKKGTEWEVNYPIQCTVGTRGPLLRLRKDGRYLKQKNGIINNTESLTVTQEAENPS